MLKEKECITLGFRNCNNSLFKDLANETRLKSCYSFDCVLDRVAHSQRMPTSEIQAIIVFTDMFLPAEIQLFFKLLSAYGLERPVILYRLKDDLISDNFISLPGSVVCNAIGPTPFLPLVKSLQRLHVVAKVA
jgi:hypothetical protein